METINDTFHKLYTRDFQNTSPKSTYGENTTMCNYGNDI